MQGVTTLAGKLSSSSSSLFGMHHQCVAPLAANSPHRSRAISIASSKVRLCRLAVRLSLIQQNLSMVPLLCRGNWSMVPLLCQGKDACGDWRWVLLPDQSYTSGWFPAGTPAPVPGAGKSDPPWTTHIYMHNIHIDTRRFSGYFVHNTG